MSDAEFASKARSKKAPQDEADDAGELYDFGPGEAAGTPPGAGGGPPPGPAWSDNDTFFAFLREKHLDEAQEFRRQGYNSRVPGVDPGLLPQLRAVTEAASRLIRLHAPEKGPRGKSWLLEKISELKAFAERLSEDTIQTWVNEALARERLLPGGPGVAQNKSAAQSLAAWLGSTLQVLTRVARALGSVVDYSTPENLRDAVEEELANELTAAIAPDDRESVTQALKRMKADAADSAAWSGLMDMRVAARAAGKPATFDAVIAVVRRDADKVSKKARTLSGDAQVFFGDIAAFLQGVSTALKAERPASGQETADAIAEKTQDDNTVTGPGKTVALRGQETLKGLGPRVRQGGKQLGIAKSTVSKYGRVAARAIAQGEMRDTPSKPAGRRVADSITRSILWQWQQPAIRLQQSSGAILTKVSELKKIRDLFSADAAASAADAAEESGCIPGAEPREDDLDAQVRQWVNERTEKERPAGQRAAKLAVLGQLLEGDIAHARRQVARVGSTTQSTANMLMGQRAAVFGMIYGRRSADLDAALKAVNELLPEIAGRLAGTAVALEEALRAAGRRDFSAAEAQARTAQLGATAARVWIGAESARLTGQDLDENSRGARIARHWAGLARERSSDPWQAPGAVAVRASLKKRGLMEGTLSHDDPEGYLFATRLAGELENASNDELKLPMSPDEYVALEKSLVAFIVNWGQKRVARVSARLVIELSFEQAVDTVTFGLSGMLRVPYKVLKASVKIPYRVNKVSNYTMPGQDRPYRAMYALLGKKLMQLGFSLVTAPVPGVIKLPIGAVSAAGAALYNHRLEAKEKTFSAVYERVALGGKSEKIKMGAAKGMLFDSVLDAGVIGGAKGIREGIRKGISRAGAGGQEAIPRSSGGRLMPPAEEGETLTPVSATDASGHIADVGEALLSQAEDVSATNDAEGASRIVMKLAGEPQKNEAAGEELQAEPGYQNDPAVTPDVTDVKSGRNRRATSGASAATDRHAVRSGLSDGVKIPEADNRKPVTSFSNIDFDLKPGASITCLFQYMYMGQMFDDFITINIPDDKLGKLQWIAHVVTSLDQHIQQNNKLRPRFSVYSGSGSVMKYEPTSPHNHVYVDPRTSDANKAKFLWKINEPPSKNTTVSPSSGKEYDSEAMNDEARYYLYYKELKLLENFSAYKDSPNVPDGSTAHIVPQPDVLKEYEDESRRNRRIQMLKYLLARLTAPEETRDYLARNTHWYDEEKLPDSLRRSLVFSAGEVDSSEDVKLFVQQELDTSTPSEFWAGYKDIENRMLINNLKYIELSKKRSYITYLMSNYQSKNLNTILNTSSELSLTYRREMFQKTKDELNKELFWLNSEMSTGFDNSDDDENWPVNPDGRFRTSGWVREYLAKEKHWWPSRENSWVVDEGEYDRIPQSGQLSTEESKYRQLKGGAAGKAATEFDNHIKNSVILKALGLRDLPSLIAFIRTLKLPEKDLTGLSGGESGADSDREQFTYLGDNLTPEDKTLLEKYMNTPFAWVASYNPNLFMEPMRTSLVELEKKVSSMPDSQAEEKKAMLDEISRLTRYINRTGLLVPGEKVTEKIITYALAWLGGKEGFLSIPDEASVSSFTLWEVVLGKHRETPHLKRTVLGPVIAKDIDSRDIETEFNQEVDDLFSGEKRKIPLELANQQIQALTNEFSSPEAGKEKQDIADAIMHKPADQVQFINYDSIPVMDTLMVTVGDRKYLVFYGESIEYFQIDDVLINDENINVDDSKRPAYLFDTRLKAALLRRIPATYLKQNNKDVLNLPFTGKTAVGGMLTIPYGHRDTYRNLYTFTPVKNTTGGADPVRNLTENIVNRQQDALKRGQSKSIYSADDDWTDRKWALLDKMIFLANIALCFTGGGFPVAFGLNPATLKFVATIAADMALSFGPSIYKLNMVHETQDEKDDEWTSVFLASFFFFLGNGWGVRGDIKNNIKQTLQDAVGKDITQLKDVLAGMLQRAMPGSDSAKYIDEFIEGFDPAFDLRVISKRMSKMDLPQGATDFKRELDEYIEGFDKVFTDSVSPGDMLEKLKQNAARLDDLKESVSRLAEPGLFRNAIMKKIASNLKKIEELTALKADMDTIASAINMSSYNDVMAITGLSLDRAKMFMKNVKSTKVGSKNFAEVTSVEKELVIISRLNEELSRNVSSIVPLSADLKIRFFYKRLTSFTHIKDWGGHANNLGVVKPVISKSFNDIDSDMNSEPAASGGPEKAGHSGSSPLYVEKNETTLMPDVTKKTLVRGRRAISPPPAATDRHAVRSGVNNGQKIPKNKKVEPLTSFSDINFDLKPGASIRCMFYYMYMGSPYISYVNISVPDEKLGKSQWIAHFVTSLNEKIKETEPLRPLFMVKSGHNGVIKDEPASGNNHVYFIRRIPGVTEAKFFWQINEPVSQTSEPVSKSSVPVSKTSEPVRQTNTAVSQTTTVSPADGKKAMNDEANYYLYYKELKLLENFSAYKASQNVPAGSSAHIVPSPDFLSLYEDEGRRNQRIQVISGILNIFTAPQETRDYLARNTHWYDEEKLPDSLRRSLVFSAGEVDHFSFVKISVEQEFDPQTPSVFWPGYKDIENNVLINDLKYIELRKKWSYIYYLLKNYESKNINIIRSTNSELSLIYRREMFQKTKDELIKEFFRLGSEMDAGFDNSDDKAGGAVNRDGRFRTSDWVREYLAKEKYWWPSRETSGKVDKGSHDRIPQSGQLSDEEIKYQQVKGGVARKAAAEFENLIKNTVILKALGLGDLPSLIAFIRTLTLPENDLTGLSDESGAGSKRERFTYTGDTLTPEDKVLLEKYMNTPFAWVASYNPKLFLGPMRASLDALEEKVLKMPAAQAAERRAMLKEIRIVRDHIYQGEFSSDLDVPMKVVHYVKSWLFSKEGLLSIPDDASMSSFTLWEIVLGKHRETPHLNRSVLGPVIAKEIDSRDIETEFNKRVDDLFSGEKREIPLEHANQKIQELITAFSRPEVDREKQGIADAIKHKPDQVQFINYDSIPVMDTLMVTVGDKKYLVFYGDSMEYFPIDNVLTNDSNILVGEIKAPSYLFDPRLKDALFRRIPASYFKQGDKDVLNLPFSHRTVPRGGGGAEWDSYKNLYSFTPLKNTTGSTDPLRNLTENIVNRQQDALKRGQSKSIYSADDDWTDRKWALLDKMIFLANIGLCVVGGGFPAVFGLNPATLRFAATIAADMALSFGPSIYKLIMVHETRDERDDEWTSLFLAGFFFFLGNAVGIRGDIKKNVKKTLEDAVGKDITQLKDVLTGMLQRAMPGSDSAKYIDEFIQGFDPAFDLRVISKKMSKKVLSQEEKVFKQEMDEFIEGYDKVFTDSASPSDMLEKMQSNAKELNKLKSSASDLAEAGPVQNAIQKNVTSSLRKIEELTALKADMDTIASAVNRSVDAEVMALTGLSRDQAKMFIKNVKSTKIGNKSFDDMTSAQKELVIISRLNEELSRKATKEIPLSVNLKIRHFYKRLSNFTHIKDLGGHANNAGLVKPIISKNTDDIVTDRNSEPAASGEPEKTGQSQTPALNVGMPLSREKSVNDEIMIIPSGGPLKRQDSFFISNGSHRNTKL